MSSNESFLGKFPRIPSDQSNISMARLPANNASAPSPAKDTPKRDSLFIPHLPRYKFEQLVLPEEVFRSLAVLECMIRKHSMVYDAWGMKEIEPYGGTVAFNLYGPSGTGKSMIVETIAAKFNKKIIDVNMAQLESKYVGETGKNIEAAFATAREQDALLFFDEADAVLGRRLSEVTQSADSSVNTARAVMLKQLEAHSGIVGFATNFAHNYDTAFVRRILKHIHIPLPDLECRQKLWQQKIPARVPGIEALDFALFARETDGFSGGDIVVAVKNALFDAARAENPVVTNEHVMRAIRDWRHAKENIGHWNRNTRKVEYSEETIENLKKAGEL